MAVEDVSWGGGRGGVLRATPLEGGREESFDLPRFTCKKLIIMFKKRNIITVGKFDKNLATGMKWL